VLSITGNNNDPSNYFYFYDWELQEAPCRSNRVAVAANVIPSPVADFGFTSSADTATFADSSLSATSWLWTFGDVTSGSGDTSVLQNPVHVFTSIDSTYNVCLVVTDSTTGCSHTFCRNIFIGSTGIPGAMTEENITIFPNPITDRLSVKFGNALTKRNWTIQLADMTGRVVQKKSIAFAVPNKKYELDLSGNARGIYMLTLENDSEKLVKKIVKE
jgi:PKD repeat protein